MQSESLQLDYCGLATQTLFVQPQDYSNPCGFRRLMAKCGMFFIAQIIMCTAYSKVYQYIETNPQIAQTLENVYTSICYASYTHNNNEVYYCAQIHNVIKTNRPYKSTIFFVLHIVHVVVTSLYEDKNSVIP